MFFGVQHAVEYSLTKSAVLIIRKKAVGIGYS